jgi:CelD/BcsL family acetyltransferase involved in cellulose biosynthesis/GNAT superfamily N-acetyltransferase
MRRDASPRDGGDGDAGRSSAVRLRTSTGECSSAHRRNATTWSLLPSTTPPAAPPRQQAHRPLAERALSSAGYATSTPGVTVIAASDLAGGAPERRVVRILRSGEELDGALRGGLLDEWRSLAAADPRASLFQAPGWCLAWYQAYHATYRPFVILVRDGETLVGIVPMAVHVATGQFDFASGSSADYRDIVAMPAYREAVVAALVDSYVEERFPNVLSVGWIDPASDTPALLASVCATRGLRTVTRTHACWRWFPPAPDKSKGQRGLNWYKRQGSVRLTVVSDLESWSAFKDEFYRQHSLRQLQAGRERPFDDPVRRSFYDALFGSDDVQTQVTGFYSNDRLVAAHVGVVWRDVLLLGAPAIRIEDEQRSPSLVLFSWIIENAQALGLRGFDLTIGDTDFKRRMGNHRVDLTVVEVHRSAATFAADRARRILTGSAKRLVTRLAGDDAWKGRVMPAVDRAAVMVQRIRERGLARTIKLSLAAAVASIHERRVGLVLTVTPDAVTRVAPRLKPGESFEVHDNTPEDLLAWNGESIAVAREIAYVARVYGRTRTSKRSLHTICINGALAGWGYSYLPTEPAALSETPGVTLAFDDGAVSLYGFYVLPEFRGRGLYQALLSEILERRFAAGATIAYIGVVESNTASRVAIERVGFRVRYRNHFWRLFSGQVTTADRQVGTG